MPTHIAIIGLNRLGGSLGLALTPREALYVVGFDQDPDVARIAQSRGALARSEWNLISAIEGADLVLFTLPLAEQRNLLAAMAPELRAGCVVASVAPLLGPPLAWAADLLPADRHFVASHPILSPAQLHTGESGLEAVRADLYANGLWALAPAPACAPEALKLIADLALLLGASPYFVDPAEHDGLMGAVDALPTLLAWALMRASTASPGWGEMRKVADREFATATAALAEPPAFLSPADSVGRLANRDNILRYLDAALAELHALRDKIAGDNFADLKNTLTEAAARRATWLAERKRGDWEAQEQPKLEMPTSGEALGRFLFGGLRPRKREEKKDR